ncbi:MAG: hypothetical protein QM808_08470 [Steroidobacteraceae bacterium]
MRMTLMQRVLAILPCTAALCFFTLPAHAELNSKQRVQAYSKLPDWTGLWEMGMGAGGPPAGGGAPGGAAPAPAAPAPAPQAAPAAGAAPAAPVVFGPRENWPFTVEAKAKYDAFQKKLGELTGTEQMPDTTVTECTWGFPRVLSGPYQFEITVTPEVVFFNYDIREFRHIWTDGRQHPAKFTPTNSGHSIGHWDGETLVVDTVGVRAGLWITGQGMTLSDKAHFTERWSMPDKDRLQAEVTIEDPVQFTKPYVLSRQFKRITDTNRMIQQNCFENIHEVKEGDKIITKFQTGQ